MNRRLSGEDLAVLIIVMGVWPRLERRLRDHVHSSAEPRMPSWDEEGATPTPAGE